MLCYDDNYDYDFDQGNFRDLFKNIEEHENKLGINKLSQFGYYLWYGINETEGVYIYMYCV